MISTNKIYLASIFSDNMVIQREMPVPVWGGTTPCSGVTVLFSGQVKTTTSDADGNWMVKLDSMPADSNPSDMIVTTEDSSITVSNILVGEVWLCSGQSNMKVPVKSALNAESEIALADKPMIRLFDVPQVPAAYPLKYLKHSPGWNVCSSDTVQNFSAVAYYFGKELNYKCNVPIGLIDSSWGGTRVESWTSMEALETVDVIKERLNVFKDRLVKSELSASAGSGTMELPAKWQERGFDFSGLFEFSKEVELPEEWNGRELKLSIGAVDKDDCTFFNGVKVGALSFAENSSSHTVIRKYNVPGELVKIGSNTITVKVNSDFFDGGMTGPAEAMNIVCPALPESSAIGLAGIWQYSIKENHGLNISSLPTELFNGMIRPLIPFAIRGSIWYQGENNSDKPIEYRKLLPTFIKDWREQWGQGDFPFNIVQLANWSEVFEFQKDSKIALLREAQEMALDEPNTMMAVTVDIGEVDCHAKNKQDVGLRLAANACAKIYGIKDMPCSGPFFKSMKTKNNNVQISFHHSTGLKTKDGEKPVGFMVAGIDRCFFSADAEIDGEAVVLKSNKVNTPVHVRYAWADNPICNLCNSYGFPTAPFRTDKMD